MKRKTLDGLQYPTITELLRLSGVGKEDQLLFQEERENGRRVTIGRWREELLETAAKFQQHPAKHIGVVCSLTYQCVLCLYAILVAGKVAVPLEADLTAEELARYAQKADIDLLLYHKGGFEGDFTCCEAMQLPAFLQTPAEPLSRWPQWEGDRNACIFFTSGTEGTQNAVVLTQKNLAFVNSYNCYHRSKRPPRLLVFLPIHHVFAFMVVTVGIHDSNEIHLSSSVKYVARELQTVKPDALTTVPMVNQLFRSQIAKGIAESGKAKALSGLVRLSRGLLKLGIDLRAPLFRKVRERFGCIPLLFISGGAAADPETMEFFADFGVIILQIYGLTETVTVVTANTLEQNRFGSVGRPLKYNQVRIKDGEVQVRGENVMKEYYKDPQATALAFDDGWFRTGDLGYFDKDGYLYITGRKKNLIILDSGENVSPEELEKQLLRSPLVREVVVCQRDKRIHAQIITQPCPGTDEAAATAAIREWVDRVNRQNPVYKRISSWELRKEPFEKTSSLKIRRN